MPAASPALAGLRQDRRNPAAGLRRWLALVVILAGPFLGVVDFFVANLAIASIRTSLGATFAQVELVLVGYGLAYAICLITGGRLGDIYGRRRMFLLGMGAFVLTSAGCGTAQSANALIVWRIAQGVAAAVMFPQALSFIRVSFSEQERRTAFGVYGTALGLAAIVGQSAGGFVLGANLFGWEWRPIFLLNVPVGLLTLVAAAFLVPESRSAEATSLDLPGSALVSAALFLFVYPLAEGREAGWPAWAWLSLLASVPLFVAFLRYERWRSAHVGSPLVEPRLLADRAFVCGLFASLVYFAGHSSMLLILTLFLQNGAGLSVASAGLALLPFSVAFLLGSALSPRVGRRLQHRTVFFGAVIVSLGLLLLILRTTGLTPLSGLAGWWGIPLGLGLYGLGRGFVTGPLFNSVLGSVRATEAGSASGILSTTQQLGNSLGVAVIGLVLFSVLPANAQPADYLHAFELSCGLNLALMLAAAALSAATLRGVVPAAPAGES